MCEGGRGSGYLNRPDPCGRALAVYWGSQPAIEQISEPKYSVNDKDYKENKTPSMFSEGLTGWWDSFLLPKQTWVLSPGLSKA